MTIQLLAVLGVLSAVQVDSEPKIRRTPEGLVFPNELKEEYFVETIKRLASSDSPPELSAVEKQLTADAGRQDLLPHIDEFLKRFPESPFRDESLVIKLRALAALAQVESQFLTEFIALTEDLTAAKPKGRLAEETAFYAIQAFVLGARAEQMAEDRRVQGAIERYAAYIEDFPKSPHRPVVWASLIRNLLAAKKSDDAAAELNKMRREFPQHKATKRASGELYRVKGIGKPFEFDYKTSDGNTVSTRDFRGSVLVVHFWATWSEVSVAGLAELKAMNAELGEKDLRLMGINVDRSGALAKEAIKRYEMPWPQYFDERGLENELFVGVGVLQLPTFLVVDREGILRGVVSQREVRSMVDSLLGAGSAAKGQAAPSGG